MLIGPSGNLISSEDKLTTRGLKSPKGLIAGSYAIRFHLHPSVKAQMMGDGSGATLILRNGETWRMSSNADEMRIEESVLLADPRGPQPTSQVVLAGMMGEGREVRIVWNLEKTGDTDAHPLVDPNETPEAETRTEDPEPADDSDVSEDTASGNDADLGKDAQRDV
jgi:hypothetical protein